MSVSSIGNFGSFSNVHSSYMSKFEQIRNQDIFETFEFSLKDSVLDYILPIRRHLNTTTFNQAKLIRKWGGKKERAQFFLRDYGLKQVRRKL